MKKITLRVDITDPTKPFVHKGWARKGHTYVSFRALVSAGMPHNIFCNSVYGKYFLVPSNVQNSLHSSVSAEYSYRSWFSEILFNYPPNSHTGRG